jgi:transcriptional regulator with XRE-family HTH domain
VDLETQLVEKVVKLLKQIREDRGISQYRLSKDTGLSASGIRHMEKDRVKPTLYFLLRISNYLGVNLADLLRQAQEEERG